MVVSTIIIFSTGFFTNTSTIAKTDAFNTQDLQLKLNFLIEKQSDPSSLKSFPYILMGYMFFNLLLLFGGDLLLRPIKYLFPDHIFLIGKEIEKNSKRLTLRQNILWVVIIGSIVCIITGLIVWFITTK
jgi:hypothetical protein